MDIENGANAIPVVAPQLSTAIRSKTSDTVFELRTVNGHAASSEAVTLLEQADQHVIDQLGSEDTDAIPVGISFADEIKGMIGKQHSRGGRGGSSLSERSAEAFANGIKRKRVQGEL